MMLQKSFDAVVLGGGVIGCSTAFALAERGLSVGLVEKAPQVGAGATSRSSACVRTHYSVMPNAVMANHALRFFERFDERLRVGSGNASAEEFCAGLQQPGLLLVGADDALGHSMAASVQRLADEAAVDTRLVTRAEAEALHPLLETRDAGVFGFEPRSGFADPHLTTSAFARAARGLGAELLLGCAATGLDVVGGRVAGVRTDVHGLVKAPLVFSCLNIWTGPLLGAWLGACAGGDGAAPVILPVRPEKHSLISLRAREPHAHAAPGGGGGGARAGAFGALGAPFPMTKDLIQDAQPYFRPVGGGRELLVGDNLPAHRRSEDDPDNWDEGVDMEHVAFCAEIAARRFPAYADAQITASWSGLYDISPDYNPVLGAWPELPGLSVAFGFSGHGFKLAPMVGQMLADDALGLPPLDAACDIGKYSVGRFAAGEHLKGVYEGAAS